MRRLIAPPEANKTGLPDPLKAGVEHLSGMALDDVQVHYNSDKPARVQASAYTQGTEIHVAPGQERHLPHEAWHVVQQAQGRVQPTLQMKDGVQVNDDEELEREADVMGERAVQRQAAPPDPPGGFDSGMPAPLQPIQRQVIQRFEAGEHAMIGVGPSTSTYPDGEGDLTLPQGAVIFTGEMVAFGDFYADMEQLLEAPRQEVEALAGLCRIEAIWYKARRLAAERAGNTVSGQVAPNAPGATATEGPGSASTPGGEFGRIVLPDTEPLPVPGGPQAERLKNQPGEVPEAVWREGKLANGKTLLEVRTAIFNQFQPVWTLFGITIDPAVKPETGMGMVKATLGRRRFRSGGSGHPGRDVNQGENDSLANQSDLPGIRPNLTRDPSRMGGDFLDLAMNNLSHFTTDNWDSWAAVHVEACKDAKGSDPLKARLAKAKDMLGSHFLTDRFSTGHFVDKAELMTYATNMMITQAEANLPKQKKGTNYDTLLTEQLKAAVQVCFQDENVVIQWQKGVAEARKNGVLGEREAGLLAWLPASTIAEKLVEVIMGMPWRHFDPAEANSTSAAGRNYGPTSVMKSKAEPSHGEDPGTGISYEGDYHLGVGNLAALQVHDALNAIGFTVLNGKGQQWRAQGDDHMSATTQDIAHACVKESLDQVDAGTPDLPAIAKYLPSQAYIDPAWISDYFLSELGTAVFDGKAINDLRSYVNGRTIPINHQGGHTSISPEMTSICHQIMNILFIQPPGATALQDDGNTGLNISRLKAFLIGRLHDMVGFAYMATSAADLPAAALELYAPRDPVTRAILPRSANDFVWNDSKLAFNLNVTECTPGRYTLVAHVWNRESGYDIDPRGQKYGRGNADQEGAWLTGSVRAIGGATNNAGMYTIGQTDRDRFVTSTTFTVDVPAGGNDPRKRNVLPVQIEIPKEGGLADESDRYVVIAGDSAGLTSIGRSNQQSDGAQIGNQTPVTGLLPVATGQGAPKTAPTPPRVKGVHNNAFKWTNNTVLFSLALEKPAEADGTVTVWVREMDWDLIGSDAQNGTPRAVTANVFRGMDYSQTIVHTPLVDNWNDTYVQVFRDQGCTDKIAESRAQGHDRGVVVNLLGRNPGQSVSEMVWVGDTLRFRVAPPDSDPVYVRFFDKDWGYDYGESGKKEGRAGNEDDPIGGIHTVQINNGIGVVISDGDSDTYGIVYQDPACNKPLKRSGTHG